MCTESAGGVPQPAARTCSCSPALCSARDAFSRVIPGASTGVNEETCTGAERAVDKHFRRALQPVGADCIRRNNLSAELLPASLSFCTQGSRQQTRRSAALVTSAESKMSVMKRSKSLPDLQQEQMERLSNDSSGTGSTTQLSTMRRVRFVAPAANVQVCPALRAVSDRARW